LANAWLGIGSYETLREGTNTASLPDLRRIVMTEKALATCTDHCCATIAEDLEPRRIYVPEPGFMR